MSAVFIIIAGTRRKAEEWLVERGVDYRSPALRIVTFPEDLECCAGAALDLSCLIPASGPLRRALAARRDRFAFRTEGEFLEEMRLECSGGL